MKVDAICILVSFSQGPNLPHQQKGLGENFFGISTNESI